MYIIIALLIILLAAVIAIYIVRQMPLDAGIKNIVLLIVGAIAVIAVIAVMLQFLGIAAWNPRPLVP